MKYEAYSSKNIREEDQKIRIESHSFTGEKICPIKSIYSSILNSHSPVIYQVCVLCAYLVNWITVISCG